MSLKPPIEGAKVSAPKENREPDVATEDVQFEHFGADDPHRAARIAALQSETRAILQEVGLENSELYVTDPRELRDLQKYADERAKWSPAQKDAFRTLLRMGQRTPPRAGRVL
jgi:predicted GNAT superfamily acetyltransferase